MGREGAIIQEAFLSYLHIHLITSLQQLTEPNKQTKKKRKDDPPGVITQRSRACVVGILSYLT